MCRCGIYEQGSVVGLGMLGQWLDWMIVKVLSKLNDSVIPCAPVFGLNAWQE